ncbi:MAG TPA: helix-turn-helix domain-containing protein, partial [Planctomycetota bacterium]|nr:helix-turn-helix domain-containing protein [Planctomycetota bacterium]
DWPGNVRELRNVIDACSAVSIDGTISLDGVRVALADAGAPRPVREVVKRAETERIRLALARHPGDLRAAARDLGISRTTLWRKMTQHGLDPGPGAFQD